jgi:hypothetical protein
VTVKDFFAKTTLTKLEDLEAKEAVSSGSNRCGLWRAMVLGSSLLIINFKIHTLLLLSQRLLGFTLYLLV